MQRNLSILGPCFLQEPVSILFTSCTWLKEWERCIQKKVVLNIHNEPSESNMLVVGTTKLREVQQDSGGDSGQICLLTVFMYLNDLTR